MGQTISNLWDVGADTVHTVGNAIRINDNSEDKDTTQRRLMGRDE